MKNYYDELEVSKTASKETIGKVYKILAKKYHPDTTKETDKQAAEEKFKIISEAYEILSDDEKRKKYDLELEESNPTISYEDYINIINQRDTLNNELNNLKNEFYQSQNSFNPHNTQTQYTNEQSQFNQTKHNFNNDYNTTHPNINNKKKKYYYNTVTGERVSTLDYYKYKIRKFISNIGFYILLILVILLAIKNLFSYNLDLQNIIF